MTTSSPPKEALAALTLSAQPDEESNPWAAKPTEETREEPVILAATGPPPPAEEPVFTPAVTPLVVDQNVLKEFDPLADNDEKAAQEAWASAESHPPPKPEQPANMSAPQTPIHSKPLPADPESPTKAAPTSASAFTNTFANLARTFSRPRSSGPDTIPSSNPRTSVEIGRPATPQTPVRSDSRAKPADGQFDFQRFLDQLKTKSAEPVSQYLRSFLNHFSRRTFTVQDQVKLVQQFLAFIEPKMRECSVWRRETEEEFENSMEAMEKLVMNRVYDYTFTPQVHASGRQITTDDLEKDHVLSQRIRLFGWVTEKHLDIPVGENNQGFLNFAEQELLKINHYKAPRDKMICILNCCKVIFGLLRQLKNEQGADAFVPVLILVVLQANPEHLLSNVEYIQRFRSPSKLQSESGYYLSSLMGAVSFIETMDHTSLSNITQEEFERNVEEAIQNLPETPNVIPPTPSEDYNDGLPEPPKTPSAAPAPGEESADALQMPTPASVAEDTRKFLQRTGTLAQQTISKPLNAIGKLLSEALDGLDDDNNNRRRGESSQWNNPERIQQYAEDPRTPQRGTAPVPIMQAPYKTRVRPGSSTPSPSHTPSGPPALPPRRGPDYFAPYPGVTAEHRGTPSPEDQNRNLAAEIGAIEDAHRQAAHETIVQIFPTAEPEVIDMVLEANGGDLGRTIDAILEMMSSG
ncbi:related to VPS9 (involved in vacuole trafficking) [Serendipita indica DSM 11827]|uniref:Related to VPS9 (Involved in vacuole trafficking) n=1 Tax=Serendipita indica (strain DSM 11827) TaxID=1109443 RepID=G4U2U5_SERID|nr:related to VPS9 (involved in vacuole trafficking) [Serendipita indica DSM 11827]